MDTTDPIKPADHGSESDAARSEQSPDVVRLIQDVEAQLHGLKLLRDQHVHLQEDLAQRERALVDAQNALQATEQAAERARSEMEQLRATLDEREAELNERETVVVERRRERDELSLRVGQLESQIEASDRAAKDATERAELLEEQLGRARGELSAASDRCEQLERQAAEAVAAGSSRDSELSAALEGSSAEIAELTRALAESTARAEKAEARAAEIHASGEQESAALDEANAQLGAMTDRIAGLQTELDGARGALEAAQAASGVAPGAGPLSTPEGMQRRRQRLVRYKELLQAQGHKIVQAQTLLRRRHKEYEQLLAQRQLVAQAVEKLKAAESKVHAKRARFGALGAMVRAVLALGVLAVLSWEIAGRAAPGEYAATATIAIDDKGKALSDRAVETWQAFHDALPSDPQMITFAAERMERRGIVDLADPADLKARLERDLDVVSPAQGEIALELRGEGREGTARELDTLVLAMTARSNATRSQRTDGAGARIAEQAEVGEQPLDEHRLYAAGAIFGGSTIFTTVLFGILWVRMAKSKARMEASLAVEESLAHGMWPPPEQAGSGGSRAA